MSDLTCVLLPVSFCYAFKASTIRVLEVFSTLSQILFQHTIVSERQHEK